MGNVVQLRQPSPEIEPSTFSAAWTLLPDSIKRRSKAKAKCEAAWDREAKRLGGQLDLLGRLKTYIRDDTDLKRTGGPALDRLLSHGRLEFWTPMETDARTVEPFPMADLRAQVSALKGEAFCRSYLDRCSVEGSVLLVPTTYSMDKLREVGAIMRSYGLSGMKRAQKPL